MRAGRGSKTAVLVCMGRALADGERSTAGFSDSTALALLPEEARERVERIRSGVAPKGLRQTVEQRYLERQSKVMVARTIAIDDAVSEAAAPQLVILGAGLDGRAWRMPQLSDVDVFEVDHPDSQREKRARVGSLKQLARDVHFVSVDFARDNLDDALTAAGHDPTLATTWVWEGVVMYLARRDIEATLDVIGRRSAKGSRLVVLYHRPAFVLRVAGPVLRWVGEPLRSSFRPKVMRGLLAKYRFEVVRDQSLPEIGEAMSAEMGKATKVAKHLRIVTAAIVRRSHDVRETR
jgi:methyltransferase (TIGR00027 family)